MSYTPVTVLADTDGNPVSTIAIGAAAGALQVQDSTSGASLGDVADLLREVLEKLNDIEQRI